jgi:hypothetical protein
MVEFDGVRDAVGAHGRAADDRGGFLHGSLEIRRRPRRAAFRVA